MTVVTLAVTAPLAFVAHLALARSAARRLTLLSLGLSALLVVPFRDPNVVAIVLGVGAIALARTEMKVWSRLSALATLEGRIARGLLFVPLALLFARTVYLYDPTALLTGVFLLSIAYVVFEGAPRVAGADLLVASAQAGAALLAGAGWFFVSVAAQPHLVAAASLPLLVLPYSASLTFMSARTPTGGQTYRRAAAVIAVGGLVINSLAHDTTLAHVLCLVAAIAVAGYGTVARHRTELLVGIAAAGLALVRQLARSVHVEDLLNWGTLSAVGIMVIFLAAYVERNQGRIATFAAWFQHRSTRV
jgi:hypothetical protein